MASGSSKDTFKALNSAFSAPTIPPTPLPDELLRILEAFVERHQDIEDSDSQRLHDELLAIYQKHVAVNPDKHDAFISVLRQLRSAIKGESRLNEWWNLVIRPTIDAIGHTRDAIEEAREFLLGILVFDNEEDKTGEKARLSATFVKKLLDAYLCRTRVPTADTDTATPEDEFIAHELEMVLVAFGRKKPKELLLALDTLFVQKEHRLQALNLLSAFVRLQPPHLYLVLQTSLIDHLVKCLLIDTSATVVYLALNILIMFLPHVTSSLVSYLPRLFLIYARILCWDRYGRMEPQDEKNNNADSSNNPDTGEEERNLETDPGWEKLHQAFDDADAAPPSVDYLFTFLYGLFPLNFMNFIYKPRKYLKQIKFPGAEELDFKQDMIRYRTEPHRQLHLLHPNFFNFLSAEDELADNRWLKSDPADLITECMELCVRVSALLQDPGPPPTAKLPDIPESLVRTEDIPLETLRATDDESTLANDLSPPADFKSNTSWRVTPSTVVNSGVSAWNIDPLQFPRKASPAHRSHPSSRSSRAPSPASKARNSPSDSPTLPPKGAPPVTDSKGEDSPKRALQYSRKGSVISASSHAGVSPRLEAFVQRLSKEFPLPPVRHSVQGHNVATLQREVMLLRNDLNFERYLKQQHLSHIGQLQRKNIKEATVEAETQNLFNANRMLKAKLTKSNEQYAQLKKETITSRNQSKKWESELSSKVRSYREEEKQWQAEEEALRLELERAKTDCEHLRRLVVESEARELLSQQKLRSLELDVEGLEALRREVELLQTRLRQFELRELEFDQAKEDQGILRTELETANLKLNSRDADRERQKKIYDRKIAELESRLQMAEQPLVPGQLPPSLQQVIDAALAASNSKMQQLKKAHTRLLHKYTELEMRVAEIDGEQEAGPSHMNSSGYLHDLSHVTGGASMSSFGRKGSVGGTSSGSGLPTVRGFHRPHVFSEPTAHDDEDDDLSAYGRYYAGSTSSSLPSSSFPPGRPVRADVLQSRPPPVGRSLSPTANTPSAYGPGYGRDVHGQPQVRGNYTGDRFRDEPVASNNSAFSVESNVSGGKSEKAKMQITPKSEVRVYGRGGAQNIGKKKQDKAAAEKKDKAKSGGFRGIKGIMQQSPLS